MKATVRAGTPQPRLGSQTPGSTTQGSRRRDHRCVRTGRGMHRLRPRSGELVELNRWRKRPNTNRSAEIVEEHKGVGFGGQERSERIGRADTGGSTLTLGSPASWIQERGNFRRYRLGQANVVADVPVVILALAIRATPAAKKSEGVHIGERFSAIDRLAAVDE